MTLLSVQTAALTGPTITYTAATAGGETVPLTDNMAVIVKCGATPTTVTVVVPGNTKYGQAFPDIPISVTANTDRLIGPFDRDMMDPATGLITITTSSQTAVTMAAIRVA